MGIFPEGQTTLSAEGMGSYCFHLGFHALPLQTYFLFPTFLGFSADWSLQSHRV